jgi:hypothetical protein
MELFAAHRFLLALLVTCLPLTARAVPQPVPDAPSTPTEAAEDGVSNASSSNDQQDASGENDDVERPKDPKVLLVMLNG